MRALALLCVAALGLCGSGRASRSCPDLVVDSCHCSAERTKELSRQHVPRVKVGCGDLELMDPLPPGLLPSRTVSL